MSRVDLDKIQLQLRTAIQHHQVVKTSENLFWSPFLQTSLCRILFTVFVMELVRRINTLQLVLWALG